MNKIILFLLIIQNICIFVSSTPKPEQKSLVLVFDTTGSMHNVLVQLRQSAIEITEKLTADKDNPIYNYIFSPFNDPGVGPTVNTKDKNILLNTLRAITVTGGGDCPELSMQGIIDGITDALPESYVFVFTDASAKDSYKVDDVISLVQKKQATVSFLVTGYCDNSITDKEIYNRIVSNSNGQLFNLKTESVGIVLNYVKSTLDARNEILAYRTSPVAGSGMIGVDVESSMDEISVVIAGASPTVKVIDPNEKISDKAVISLNLDGIMAAVVKDPAPGHWKFNYSSTSGHSVKINALTNLSFKFGFSKTIAKSKEETSPMPLPDDKNIVTIFPSDSLLIKNLTEIKIAANDISGSDTFEILLPLTKYRRSGTNIYRTALFNVPKIQFKLYVLGYDRNGNVINRILSLTVQPPGPLITEKAPPEVTIDPPNLHITEGEDISLICNVISYTNIKTEWQKNGIILASSSTSFGTELMLNITASSLADAGLYECISKSKNGQKSTTINIEIDELKFGVKIPEKKYVVSAGDELVIPCIVDTTRDFEIIWSRNNISLTSWSKGDATTRVYKKSNVDKHSSGIYSCHVRISNKILVDATDVIINYEPIIKEKAVETKVLHFGDTITIECNADAMPTARIFWMFSPKSNPNPSNNIGSGHKIEIETISRDSVGDYTCEVGNGNGSKQKRVVTIIATSENPPKIIKASSTNITVKTGTTFELDCKCDNCSPLNDYFWKINGTTINKITNRFKNIEAKRIDILHHFKNATAVYKLKVANAAHDGQYECGLSNALGKDKIIYNVIANYPPRYITSNTIQKHKVIIGKTLKLDCTMNSKPKATLSWYKNGVKLKETSNELKLRNSTKDDNGEYICNATNYLDFAEVVHYVDVQYKPNILKISDNLEVIRYTNFSLECVAEGNDLPALTWKKDNKIILTTSKLQYNDRYSKALKRGEVIYLDSNSNGHELKDLKKLEKLPFTGMLNIIVEKKQTSLFLYSKNMTRGWLKEVKCVASNKIGTIEKRVNITILDYPKFKKLKQKNNPMEVEVQKGMNLQLDCNSIGTPKPKRNWYKDGILIKPNAANISKFSNSNQRLEIFDTKETDSGKYTCVAKNKLGEVSYNFNVTINYPPIELNNGFIERTQKKNDDLELDCYTDSKPPAEYFWFIIDLKTRKEIALNETSPVMKIINIQSTKIFLCSAENTAGKVYTEFQININEPPQILNNTDEYIELEHGIAVTMHCRISQVIPKPTIQWLKNNSSVNLTGMILLNENESLHLYNVKILNSGTYTCLVENSLGKMQKKFEVIVKQPKIIWSNWTPFTACTTSCGKGLKMRTRFCNINNEDKVLCKGDVIEKIDCNNEPCPIHGGWGNWSNWSSCSTTCISSFNEPFKSKTRECDNPKPSIYGNFCNGSHITNTDCTVYDIPPCKIDGGWSEKKTTKCNNRCFAEEFRTCTNPAPENGGDDCVGNKIIKRFPCYIEGCIP